jgi:hypothetical protein
MKIYAAISARRKWNCYHLDKQRAAWKISCYDSEQLRASLKIQRNIWSSRQN